MELDDLKAKSLVYLGEIAYKLQINGEVSNSCNGDLVAELALEQMKEFIDFDEDQFDLGNDDLYENIKEYFTPILKEKFPTKVLKKVVVVSCQDHNWWYRDLLGQTVDVAREVKGDYLLHERHFTDVKGEYISTGLVSKSDCIEVKES